MKAATKTAEPAASPATSVAVIQPPRLPYHPAIEQRFGVDRAGWKVLCESIFPSAKTPDSIVLALSYCKARRLDPFKRNIHIVPIYDAKKRVEVETVWPGIAELRTTAMRTKGYAGMDAPAFGPTVTRKFKGSQKSGDSYTDVEVEVSFPEWCRITVHRIVQGNRVPFPGPTVYWLEFYNKQSRFVEAPNEQWRRRPSQMLEKCAEAGALRRAFPEEFGEEYTVEEIGAFGSLAVSAKPVAAEVVSTSPIEPTRADFQREQTTENIDTAAAEVDDPPHDPETGEVADPPDRSWKLADSIVGQDAKLAAILDLLTMAEIKADVDAIEAEHKAFLDKLGVKKAAAMRAFTERRQELPEEREAA